MFNPMKPETSLPRVKELVKEIDGLFKELGNAKSGIELDNLERKTTLFVNELVLTAGFLSNQTMQISRNRRTELANGVAEKPVEKVLKTVKEKVSVAKKTKTKATNK